MLECLRGFEAELVESEDGRYDVQVSLDNNRDINRVLGAIDTHVTERADGPARLDLDGRHYLIEPGDNVEQRLEVRPARMAAPG
jgi:hypothetical protein